MAFRVFRNDAIRKYRSQFDMAARYAYLAATAYDYETNLLGTSGNAGRRFLATTSCVTAAWARSSGPTPRCRPDYPRDSPIAGSRGLADPLARMKQNFDVLRGQLGFNNPQNETNRFSLRTSCCASTTDPASDTRTGAGPCTATGSTTCGTSRQRPPVRAVPEISAATRGPSPPSTKGSTARPGDPLQSTTVTAGHELLRPGARCRRQRLRSVELRHERCARRASGSRTTTAHG